MEDPPAAHPQPRGVPAAGTPTEAASSPIGMGAAEGLASHPQIGGLAAVFYFFSSIFSFP
eukprot:9969868-Prorocentrum_lima.AAC.1